MNESKINMNISKRNDLDSSTAQIKSANKSFEDASNQTYTTYINDIKDSLKDKNLKRLNDNVSMDEIAEILNVLNCDKFNSSLLVHIYEFSGLDKENNIALYIVYNFLENLFLNRFLMFMIV